MIDVSTAICSAKDRSEQKKIRQKLRCTVHSKKIHAHINHKSIAMSSINAHCALTHADAFMIGYHDFRQPIGNFGLKEQKSRCCQRFAIVSRFL